MTGCAFVRPSEHVSVGSDFASEFVQLINKSDQIYRGVAAGARFGTSRDAVLLVNLRGEDGDVVLEDEDAGLEENGDLENEDGGVVSCVVSSVPPFG